MGKTYLACALGHQACRDVHRTIYMHGPKLFRALQTAHADGSLSALFKKLSRASLLIVDDLGIVFRVRLKAERFIKINEVEGVVVSSRCLLRVTGQEWISAEGLTKPT